MMLDRACAPVSCMKTAVWFIVAWPGACASSWIDTRPLALTKAAEVEPRAVRGRRGPTGPGSFLQMDLRGVMSIGGGAERMGAWFPASPMGTSVNSSNAATRMGVKIEHQLSLVI